MKVKELMTDNIASCGESNSLQDVAKLMKDNDCGMIPIVEGNGRKRVIGTVTDRDIVMRCVAEGKNPLNGTAGDVMSTDPITISESDSDDDAAKLMSKHQIRRLVVTDDNDNCIGVISQADLAMNESDSETGDVVKNISKPSNQPRQ